MEGAQITDGVRLTLRCLLFSQRELRTLADARYASNSRKRQVGFAGGLLATAAHATATRTIRNCATVGGSILSCGMANDLVVALLALDAAIVSASGDSMCLEDALANGGVAAHVKLLLEARLPLASSDWRSAFVRISRLPSDHAIVNVAAVLRCDHGVYKDVRLAAGGVGKTPIRLKRAERLLRGSRLSVADIKKAIDVQKKEVSPLSDILGSSEYRSEMLGVLLRRAVQQCQVREEER